MDPRLAQPPWTAVGVSFAVCLGGRLALHLHCLPLVAWAILVLWTILFAVLVRGGRLFRPTWVGPACCPTAVAVLVLPLCCVVFVVSLWLSLSSLVSLAFPVRPLNSSPYKKTRRSSPTGASPTTTSRRSTSTSPGGQARRESSYLFGKKLRRPRLRAREVSRLSPRPVRPVIPERPSRRRRLDMTAPRRSAGRKAFLAPSLLRGLRPRVLMPGRGTQSPSGSLRGFRPSARAPLSPTGCSGIPWEEGLGTPPA